MGLFKAMMLGLAAAVGVPAIVRHGNGVVADLARFHSFPVKIAGLDLLFSMPIFLGVALFGWVFFYWSRD